LTKRRGQSTIIEDYRRQRVNLKPHHFATVRFSILINQLLYKRYDTRRQFRNRFQLLGLSDLFPYSKYHYQLNACEQPKHI